VEGSLIALPRLRWRRHQCQAHQAEQDDEKRQSAVKRELFALIVAIVVAIALFYTALIEKQALLERQRSRANRQEDTRWMIWHRADMG